MTKRICKLCGKEFEAKGTQVYCNDKHYKTCVVCGQSFEINRRTLNKVTCSSKCQSELRKQTLQKTVKICELCGKPFVPNGSMDKYCKNIHYRPCPICGKPVPISPGQESGPAVCCSVECSNKLRERTCEEKYGVKNASQSDMVRHKISEHNKSLEVVNQRKATCLRKYGYENVSQVLEIKQKQIRTFESKYGCTNPMKNERIAKKVSDLFKDPQHIRQVQETLLSRYGVTATKHIPGVKQKAEQTCIEHYGVPYYVLTEEYRHPKISNIKSNVNQRFQDLLKQNNINSNLEFRIETKVFDIKVDGTNILLEIDPTYTHNAFGNHWNKDGLDKNYHRDKSRLAQQHGYRCIHIFDWDNVDKIVFMLKPKETLYARKCEIQEVDKQTCDEFLSKYHLQNTCNGQKVRIGLFYKNELVELMTFGRPRYNKHYQWELLRLCTKSEYKVVGGATRLFKHFVEQYNPENIISYCDLAKFSGRVYDTIGMKLLRITAPAKVWSYKNHKITDSLLRQRGYDQLFNENYGKGTDNETLMIEHGWLPVYDCGQAVYEWRNTDVNKNL